MSNGRWDRFDIGFLVALGLAMLAALAFVKRPEPAPRYIGFRVGDGAKAWVTARGDTNYEPRWKP